MMKHEALPVKYEGGDADAQSRQLEAYAFVPAALRHDFWREAEDDTNDSVVDARRTRSALLVATLLHGEGNQHDIEHKAVRATCKQKAKTSPERQTSTDKKLPSDAATEIPTATSSLYSLSVESTISKRMVFASAVQQLDDYFSGLRSIVDELHKTYTDSLTVVPPWVWDASTKLPTLLQIQRKIVESVASCLPDCDVYLAMYEWLPMANPAVATPSPLLRYVADSPQSTMLGRVLSREVSSPEESQRSVAASFAVLDTLDSLLVQDVGDPATAAGTVQWLGHVSAHSMLTGPFACLPLVDARGMRGIGVLALDACRKAAQLRPEAMSPQALFELLVRMQLNEAAMEFRKLQFGGRQFLQLTANDLQHRPAYRTLKIQTKQRVLEIVAALRSGLPLHLPRGQRPQFFCDDDDALTLLDDVCDRAGRFMDEYARGVHWYYVMANRTRDGNASALDVYASLVHGISQALTGVERVGVWKIRDCADVDALATTHLPDDRLLPFLQWSERQIRRVPLYMENNEDQGRLMQGNVTRINLPPPSEPSVLSQPCERALYHLTWSNRTQQSLSWPQLRLILPIRPLNARHHQLTQLLERLRSIRSENESLCGGTHFRLTGANAFVVLLKDPDRPNDVVYALQVNFLPHPNDGTPAASLQSDSETFLQRAVAITQQNLLCVRKRQERSTQRQLSTAKITRNFGAFGLTPSADALRTLNEIVASVFDEINTNLPGTQQQIAELQGDGAHLCFTFAGHGSTLAGKTLNRGQGVSFRCIDSRLPLIVHYGSELRSRLKKLSAGVVDMVADLPYMFLPLLYEDTCVGVLSVNRFVDVPKGRADETHPEDGVVEFLASLAKLLAAAIYLKRRAFALHTLQQERLEPLQSPEQLFLAASRVLEDTMLGVWKLRILEIDFVRGKSTTVYEYSEAARLEADTVLSKQVIPLGFRARELLPDTIASHWAISRDEVDTLLQLWSQHGTEAVVESVSSDKVLNDVERRKLWEARVRRRYYRLDLKPLEDEVEDSSKKQRTTSQASKGIVTRTSNQKYVAQALSTSLGTKTVAYAGVDALKIANSSAVYLAVATQPQLFASCEQTFVDRVGETLSRLMESLVQRVNRSRQRVCALGELQIKCSNFVNHVATSLGRKASKGGGFPLTPAEERRVEGSLDLLDDVVRFVSAVLECPNVYVALHESFHRRLHYVASSPSSIMKNKILHRGHGVSFHALDHQQSIVMTAATQAQIEKECGHNSKLRRFSNAPPETQKWPFVVVPINSFGVLALDNLEKLARLSSESQPEFGLVDFLRRVAHTVGETHASIRQLSHEHRRQIREQAVVSVMAACDDRSKRTSPLYLQHLVLHTIERAFNGVDAYIGMLQPLCASMLFTSATTHSGMMNQHVNTSDSVSFRVFLSQQPLVVPQVERKQFNISETQTAQLIHQLRWFTAAQDQGRKGPFVCIPIPFVGVLSVDTFPGAASGIYSPHVPEQGVIDCLTTMANLLGQTIREKTAAEAAREIPKLFEGNRSTFRVVFTRLLELIAQNVLTAVELCVICHDAKSGGPVHDAAVPLVCVKSLADHHQTSHPNIADLAPLIAEKFQSRQSEDPRCFSLPDHPEVLILRCPHIRDIDSAGQGAIDGSQSCRLLATAIVIRRVPGANWSYDEEFLVNVLPVIVELVERVNVRVCGIASRQNAVHALDALCNAFENSPSSSAAFDTIPRFVREAFNILTRAVSQQPADAYMGERIVGGDALIFTAASEDSLMEGVQIDLYAAANQEMVIVGCLQRQRHLVVHLLDGKNERLVRSLTPKKVQRVFAAFPMSEDRLLCVDSLGLEAFDPLHSRLERDVEAFLVNSTSRLETTIASVRYRYAYDQLCGLKSRRHPNFRDFFATIHAVLRRELTDLHSQQLVELADDFTGHFSVCSWHRAPTQRHIRGTVSLHFCFTSGCTRAWVANEIHADHHTVLPMTNAPRTLDQSRATLEPVSGREKQGAYACECLATMIDAGLEATPRLALCVYSHDSARDANKTSVDAARPTEFTSRQRQFFFASSVVASEVYTSVFRACVLESFSVESLFIARDRLFAKDAVLVSINQSDGQVCVVTGCAVAASKWLPGSAVRGKLAEKVLAFHRELLASTTVDFTMFVSKTATAVRTRSTMAKVGPAAAESLTTTTDSTEVETQAKHSFFRRPRVFGGKEKTAKVPSAAQAAIADTAALPPPPPTTEFHVLLRGHHHGEVLSLQVEREIIDHQDARELLVAELRQFVNEISATKSAFVAKPRGDEEWNGAEFGHVPEIGEGGQFGGGGFHVLSCWTQWRDAFRDQLVHFETDMRGYLTGVQATSREQLGAGVASSVRPGLLPSGGPSSSTHVSIFSRDNLRQRAAAVMLVRAALVLCGYKKEVAIDVPTEKDDDLLKEYLRANAGRKLLELNPRSTAKWAVALRAHNYTKAKCSVVASLTAAASDSEATRAARTLMVFVTAFASAVKYFRFLQEGAKQRKQNVDAIATRVQCFYRVVRAKKLRRRLKIEYAAAVTIQCAFRQRLARRKRAFLTWDRAARTVQRAYRRKLAQRRGRRPRKFTMELRTVAAQYGTMQTTPLGGDGDDAWKVEMASFDSFKAYLESRAGREQLKREEHVIAERLKDVARHREQTLSAHDRLLADAYDVFELLDIEGSGELSRERTQELMARLHIPLSGDEAADVIDMMDNDRSGAISFSEFTSWFTHEFGVLKKRSRECGVIGKRDRLWIAEESARSTIRKRWRAHQAGGKVEAAIAETKQT